MKTPRMFYFGAWDAAGHYLFNERGLMMREHEHEAKDFPWNVRGTDIDCELTPQRNNQHLGEALVHHKAGWTALAFWDRSVDRRPNSNSVFFAEGTFGLEEMVALARVRFAERWQKLGFDVVPYEEAK